MLGIPSRRDRLAARAAANEEARKRQREVMVSLGHVERTAGEAERIERDFYHLLKHTDDGKAVLASWKAWRASRAALAEAKAKHAEMAAL